MPKERLLRTPRVQEHPPLNAAPEILPEDLSLKDLPSLERHKLTSEEPLDMTGIPGISDYPTESSKEKPKKNNLFQEYIPAPESKPVPEPSEKPPGRVKRILRGMSLSEASKGTTGDFRNPSPEQSFPAIPRPVRVHESSPKPERPETPRTFNEVLSLQKDAFSARRDMIAFRHGKKVDALSPEDRQHYKELREISQVKREEWKEQLSRLPENEQDKLSGLTKLKEVEVRYAKLTPDQLLTVGLLETVARTKKELKLREEQIADTRDSESLKDLNARRRALLAKIKDAENQLTGEKDLALPAEEEIAVEDSHTWERKISEVSASARETLEKIDNELNARIDALRQKLEEMPRWKALAILEMREEIKHLREAKNRIQEQLDVMKTGFGAGFKAAAEKAYQATRRSIKSRTPSEAPNGTIPPEEPPADLPPAPPIETRPPDELPEERLAAKKRGTWTGWLWERAKGFATFGFNEKAHADRFFYGIKDASQESAQLAEQIQKERNLSLEDALAEAEEIRASVGRAGIEGASAKKIEQVSARISARKVAENNAVTSGIVISAITALETKLKKYKGVSGQDVLTEDAKNKIAVELEKRLHEMRGGYIEADAKELAKMMRQNLEPDWWKRYVYGALEAAIDTAVIVVAGKVMLGKYAASKVGAVGAKEASQVALKDTIWAEAKRQLVSHGVSNPTNAQIQQVAVKFCKDSGVKVVSKGGQLLWQETAGGVLKDIALGKGFAIHIAGGLKEIAAIKAAAIAVI